MVPAHVKSWLVADRDYKVLPWGLYWRSHTLFINGTVTIGLFVDLFLYGLVVPVLPYLLQDRIGIPIDEVQTHVSLLLAAYAGSLVVFSPFAGYIADKTSSRQQPYLWSLLALFFATLLLYVAETMAVLILARILQGIAAVVVWTVGLALCLETVGPKKLGQTIGTVYSFMGVAALVAPVIGGILYKQVGYGGIFAISIVVIALDFLMRLLVIEKKIAHRYDPSIIDPFLIDDSQEHDSSDEEAQPLLPRNDKSRYIFPATQSAIIQKVPILYCLQNSRLLISFLVTLMQALLLGSFDATVPTEAQSLFDFSSQESGLLFIPLSTADLLTGPIAGYLVDRYGVKPVAVIGFISLTPTLIAFRAVSEGTHEQMILYCILLGLSGMGIATLGAPPIVEAGDVVSRYHRANPHMFGETGPYGQLYAMLALMYAAGLALGPFISGGLREVIGYGNMNAVLGGFCAATAVASYVYLGGRPTWMERIGSKETAVEER